MFLLEPLVFLLSSILTLFLVYKKAPITLLQQITLIVLLALIVLSRFIFSKTVKTVYEKLLKSLSLFLSSFLVQLFLFSTGGFYSPFLPLLHLYTLGASFLLDLHSAILFLIFSVAILIISSFLSINTLNIFQNDPGTAIIYIISFVVLVPLAQLLVKNYQLKDAILKVVNRYLQLGQSREKLILRGLSELVIVADKDLKILSINSAVEKTLKIFDTDAVGKNILEIIQLTDEVGNPATIKGLSINEALINKRPYIIKNYSLKTAQQLLKVVLRINPIVDESNLVREIVFVITEDKLSETDGHLDLAKAMDRRQKVLESLKALLKQINDPKILAQADLFAKGDEDLISAIEIRDHPISSVVSLNDAALICKGIIDKNLEFAKTFKTQINFELPEGELEGELAMYSLGKKENLASKTLGLSNFTVPIDPHWFSLILDKILEISILLTSSYSSPKVTLSIATDDMSVDVKIKANFPKIPDEKLFDIFKLYYSEDFQSTNLRFGSGLEGFIAKNVSDEINLSLGVESTENPPVLTFTIKLAKQVK